VKDLVKKLKDVITNLYKEQSNVNHMVNLRKEIMRDPVGVVSSLEVTDLVTEDITNFAKILSVPANVGDAKEDLITVVNDIILKHVEILRTSYDEAFSLLTSIIGSNNDLLTKILNKSNVDAMKIWVTKANSSLAHSEMHEKKLSRVIHTQMTDNNITSINYIDWLYGLNKELSLINVSNVVKEYDYSNLDKYLSESNGELEDVDVATIGTDIPEYAEPYGSLINYSKTPEAIISGVTMLTNLVNLIGNPDEHVVYPQSEYTLTYDNAYDAALKLTKETLINDTMDIGTAVSDLTTMKTSINKLYNATEYVIKRETDIYVNLIIYYQSSSLVTALVAGV